MSEPVVGAGRRRTELRRQRRRQRRRAIGAALAVLAVATLLLTVYLAQRTPPVPPAAQPSVSGRPSGAAGPAQPVRVRVYNGVGTPGLAEQVRGRLESAGLAYVAGGNAPSFGVARTEVQVGEATPEALARGARVATALGLPANSVKASQPTPLADVVVVVGADLPRR